MNGRNGNENNRILRRPIHHGPFSRGAKRNGKISSATRPTREIFKRVVAAPIGIFINESGGGKKRCIHHGGSSHTSNASSSPQSSHGRSSQTFSIRRPLHCDCLICMFSPSDDLYNVLPPLARPYNSAISTSRTLLWQLASQFRLWKRKAGHSKLTNLI
jgi:hypothetical protein